jgi:hypothetical protein
MKTHKVIDLIYHDEENNEVFEGTEQECRDWIRSQSCFDSTYKIVPILKKVKK